MSNQRTFLFWFINIAKIEGVGISTVMRLTKEFCE